MNDQEKIIGLSELLDEISRDLDELRKKHSSDYNVRNISMWWELERERVVARHGSGSTVMKLRKVQSMKRMMGAFLAGWILMIALQAALWVMFR